MPLTHFKRFGSEKICRVDLLEKRLLELFKKVLIAADESRFKNGGLYRDILATFAQCFF